MAKKATPAKEPLSGRTDRLKLSAEEQLKRMEEFEQRREAFIAAVRKGKDRDKKGIVSGRASRRKVTREEALKWIEDFDQRREAFIAAVLKGKIRSVQPRSA